MKDREAVKLLTGLTDAELTDCRMSGEDAFGDPVLIGSKVTWLGPRGATRHGTVMGMDGINRCQIRDTRGNWVWRDANSVVVFP